MKITKLREDESVMNDVLRDKLNRVIEAVNELKEQVFGERF